MIGQTISHYKILEKLGEGGMGIVYKAHDSELDRAVAMKFLPQYLTSDAAEKERFHHEARAASALNHPNISTIYEIKEFESQIYLAMEYVEGKTLKQLIEADPLPIKKALDTAIQVCDGLGAAHEKGVVHRDIKSDNIMVTPKGQVKIMDFGLAKVKGATKLTKAGSTLGTAAYMSPEQAQGEEVDQRSDIFSFGVVLYELLTSKLPFRGEHHAALMYSLINEDPVPIARFNEKVTPEIERIVSKALAKDKEDRYQHVDEMLADIRRERKHLEYARAGYATTATMSQASMQPVEKKKNFLRYIIPAAAIVIVVILLLIFNPFNFQISTQKGVAASEKNSLAVMYFENIPDPEDKDHTGEMLTNLLTTSLFQTKDLEVISRERLYDLQKELGQADARTISPSMATKVAQRAGVSMMLLGSILQKQPSLAITYRLIEVQSGKILSTQRLSGFSSDKIFSLVDTLAMLVKNDLKVSPNDIQDTKSVASVTTLSPEAYRSYLEGVQLNDKFYNSEARAAFKRAIELDSNFAMAYFGLAMLSLEPDGAMKNSALSKAWQLSERVTEKERLSIHSVYAARIEKDLAKSVSLLEELVQKYPHEQRAYLGLVTSLANQGNYDNALAVCLRALENDPRDGLAWNTLAYGYMMLNKHDEAMTAIDHYMQLSPALPNAYDSKGEICCAFGELDSALYWYQKAVSFKTDFPTTYKIGLVSLIKQDYSTAEKEFRLWGSTSDNLQKASAENFLSLIPFHRGRMQESELILRRNLESFQAQKLQGPINDIYYGLILIAYQQHDYSALLDYAQKYSVEMKKGPGSVIYGRDMLALAYLKNGNASMNSKLIEDLRHDLHEDNPNQKALPEYTIALGEFEKGNYSACLEHYQKASQWLAPKHAPLFPIAVSLLKTGRIAEAIDEFQRIAVWAPIDFGQFSLFFLPVLEDWPTAAVKAHYWLGVAYEQQGKKTLAIREYQEFLDIWKDADFKSPELQDAKMRVAKLKGMAVR